MYQSELTAEGDEIGIVIGHKNNWSAYHFLATVGLNATQRCHPTMAAVAEAGSGEEAHAEVWQTAFQHGIVELDTAPQRWLMTKDRQIQQTIKENSGGNHTEAPHAMTPRTAAPRARARSLPIHCSPPKYGSSYGTPRYLFSVLPSAFSAKC